MTIEWEVIAVVISCVSLAIVIYKEFIQGSKLHSSINQLILVRIPGENKASLVQDIILGDLLSGNPSQQAHSIVSEHPNFQQSISTRNRNKLLGELIEASKRQMISYNPPENLIERYWGDRRYCMSFFVPLVVFNSGKRFAYVSSLVMVAHLKNQASKKWAFSVFVEIDPIKILQRDKSQKDTERISNLFSGFAIGPGESVQVNPWFTSITDVKNRIISRESMKPGDYVLQVFGYDSKGKRVFKTKPVDYSLSRKHLLEAFSGAESANYVNIEEHVDDATKE